MSNSIGQLKVILDRENILNKPSSHQNDSVSLLLKDINQLSTGGTTGLPGITLTCGLCRAVVIHVNSIQFPVNDQVLQLLKTNNITQKIHSVHVEVIIKEKNSNIDKGKYFCLSKGAIVIDEIDGVKRYKLEKCQFALSLETFTTPVVHVVVKFGDIQNRVALQQQQNKNMSSTTVENLILGELTIPIDGIPGVHKERNYTLTSNYIQPQQQQSQQQQLQQQQVPTISLGFRIVPRATFSKQDVTDHRTNTSTHSRRRSVAIAASKSHGHTGGISMERKKEMAAERIQHHISRWHKHATFKKKIKLSLRLSSMWRGHTTRKEVLYKGAINGNHNLLITNIGSITRRQDNAVIETKTGRPGRPTGMLEYSPRATLSSVTKVMTVESSDYVSRLRWDDVHGNGQGLLHVAARACTNTRNSSSRNNSKHLRCCAWLATTQPSLLVLQDDNGISGKRTWHDLAVRSIQRIARGFLDRQRYVNIFSVCFFW